MKRGDHGDHGERLVDVRVDGERSLENHNELFSVVSVVSVVSVFQGVST